MLNKIQQTQCVSVPVCVAFLLLILFTLFGFQYQNQKGNSDTTRIISQVRPKDNLCVIGGMMDPKAEPPSCHQLRIILWSSLAHQANQI